MFLLRKVPEVLKSKLGVFSDDKELLFSVLILYKYLEVLCAMLRALGLGEKMQAQFAFRVYLMEHNLLRMKPFAGL